MMDAFHKALAVGILAMTTGCSAMSSTGGGTVCVPPGPAPVINLVSPASGTTIASAGGMVEFATFVNNPPFSAVLELQAAGSPSVMGGTLMPITGPSPQPTGTETMAYYQASYGALTPGTSYNVLLDVTQYINLAAACQKEFMITVGTVTAQ